jgi:LacI family transcriptional regulator
VLAGIEAHDFTPVRAARSLVTGRTHVVGVILATGPGHPDLQHPFFQEVLVGLKHAVGEQGYDLLLFSVEPSENGSAGSAGDAADVGAGDGDGDGEAPTPGPGMPRGPSHVRTLGPRRYLARARQHRVDGAVLMGVDRHDPDVQELVRSGVPVMSVDLDLQGGRTGHVISDNVTGASLAVRHLAELGHRKIALIGGPGDMRPAADRLLGYRRELERLRLPHRPGSVREGDFYPESGQAEMRALLDEPDPPTAVFAASDLMAAGAIQALSDRGLSCPSDVSVMGFDDIQIAALLQPPLTTIRQDKEALGRAAGEALTSLIDDPNLDPPVVTVPVELVARDSTAASRENARART